MEYKLEFKPTARKEGVKYKNILLTDIMLHASPKRPSTFGSKLKKAFNAIGQPGRIYQHINKPEPIVENTNTFKMEILTQLQNDPAFVKYVEEERKNGFEVVIQIPKAGLPIVAGKDMVEFIKSKNGQRIIRGLAKNKPTD
ncbi:MAG: hypothetical protein WC827_01795 [Candidatus Paceibacterota bacterium]|jgi:hypothetical protein